MTAFHDMETLLLVDPVCVTPVGAAAGSDAGVAVTDGEADDWPLALVARTVNVYEVPLVRPVMVAAVVMPSVDVRSVAVDVPEYT